MIHVEEINHIEQLADAAIALERPAAADPRGHLLPVVGLAGGLLAALRRGAAAARAGGQRRPVPAGGHLAPGGADGIDAAWAGCGR